MIEGGYSSGCKGFCSFPQGGIMLTIVAILMSLLSWCLSIGVHGTCFFVRGDDRLQTGFGLWTKQNMVVTDVGVTDQYQCQEYTYAQSKFFDTKWNAASGLAYSAGTIGFIFTVLLIGTSCASLSPNFFKLAAVFYVIAGIFDFCTLVALDSKVCARLTITNVFGRADQCTFSTGAGLAVAAGICYFITAALVYCIAPKAASKRAAKEEAAAAAAAAESDASAGKAAGSNEATPPDDTAADTTTGAEEEGNIDQSNKEAVTEAGAATAAAAAAEDDGSDSDSKDSDDDDDDGPPRGFWQILSSNLLFLCGSTFFMWLAVLDLQWAKGIATFRNELQEELSDGERMYPWNRPSWADYYNTTDWQDDYVFRTRYHWVSQYQIIFFIAAASFMVEGFLDFFGTPGFQGLWFLFAGTLGLVSAWTAERDPELSSLFNLVSAHLYMLEAVGLVVYRSDYNGVNKLIKDLIKVNDICFAVATTMDVVLSYFEVLGDFNLAISQAGTAAAALWLFCGVFYVSATVCAKFLGYFDKVEELEADNAAEDKEENKVESPEKREADDEGQV